MSGTVGFGFGAFAPTIKVQRRPKNPLDKTTLVSIYPRAIIDYKPTAFPQTHRIEAAPENGFSLLVLEGAGWFKEMTDGQPFLEIPITSISQAEAFIRDFVNGLVGYVPDQAMPGLFFIPGAYDEKTILGAKSPDIVDDQKRVQKGKTFQQLLARAQELQRNWYANLVQIADKDWARTNGNPLSISDLSRLAAEALGMKNQKPWMGDIAHLERSNCPACGFSVNTMYPICPNCKAVVNETRAKELSLKFAS